MTASSATNEAPSQIFNPNSTTMKQPSDPPIPTPDAELARSYRQLRLVKALFRLDDPEVERALTLIVERLAAADAGDDRSTPVPQGPSPKPVE
jgi:hypothetical protein